MAESVTFTRRHFIKIGEILSRYNVSHELIEEFANLFKEDNPRFDKDRFIYFVAEKRAGKLKEVI